MNTNREGILVSACIVLGCLGIGCCGSPKDRMGQSNEEPRGWDPVSPGAISRLGPGEIHFLTWRGFYRRMFGISVEDAVFILDNVEIGKGHEAVANVVGLLEKKGVRSGARLIVYPVLEVYDAQGGEHVSVAWYEHPGDSPLDMGEYQEAWGQLEEGARAKDLKLLGAFDASLEKLGELFPPPESPTTKPTNQP